MLKRHTLLIISLSFIIIHLALLNINSAEWGDSYRILRAAEYIRNVSYPDDEKRPPLFSAILAVHPAGIDPVFWGKLVMVAISFLCLVFFMRLARLFIKDDLGFIIAVVLFTFNPVYLYWSLRIYADVPFSLIALVALYLLTVWRYITQGSKVESATINRQFDREHYLQELPNLKGTHSVDTVFNLRSVVIYIGLGVVVSLGILIRFEGYLLFWAVLVGLFFIEPITKLSDFYITNLLERFKKSYQGISIYILTVVLLLAPYLYWKNPLTSSYFEEPSGRTFGIKEVIIYLLSLLFAFGFIYFFSFWQKKWLNFFLQNPGITFFVLLELLLAFIWPAAIPRLFVPVVPFLLIPFGLCISSFFSGSQPHSKTYYFSYTLLILAVIWLFYFCGQKHFRLQFLIPNTNLFIFVSLLQLAIALTILLKNRIWFMSLCAVSIVFWSLATIWLHKDIYKSLKQAGEYSAANLHGTVAYNDVSSLSDWYLNQTPHRSKTLLGIYLDINAGKDLSQEKLQEKGVDYLLITNEHNPDLEIDLKKRPYLRLLQEFTYTHGGKRFFTWVVSVSYN